jgi:hypothetical protein
MGDTRDAEAEEFPHVAAQHYWEAGGIDDNKSVD